MYVRCVAQAQDVAKVGKMFLSLGDANHDGNVSLDEAKRPVEFEAPHEIKRQRVVFLISSAHLRANPLGRGCIVREGEQTKSN